MLSVFAAPGNLPEIHELEALITHVALSPLVCSQAPQERLLAMSLLHLSRTARAEQMMVSRPFHRALVTPSQTAHALRQETHRGWPRLAPAHPSLMQSRPMQAGNGVQAEPAANALPGSPCHTNSCINIYPCPCPTLRWLCSSTAISSVGSGCHPFPPDLFC